MPEPDSEVEVAFSCTFLLNASQICDSVNDCPNGDDEKNCPEVEIIETAEIKGEMTGISIGWDINTKIECFKL